MVILQQFAMRAYNHDYVTTPSLDSERSSDWAVDERQRALERIAA